MWTGVRAYLSVIESSYLAVNAEVRSSSRTVPNVPPTVAPFGPTLVLQVCEGLRPDVTHLTFQLMPYPWFERQRRLPAYAQVAFPPLPRGVSTQRTSVSRANPLANPHADELMQYLTSSKRSTERSSRP